MILQVKICEEDYELFKELKEKEKDFNVRFVKNGIIIEKEIEPENVEIELPKLVCDKNIKIYFKDAENGGGMSHWGHSHIVCGAEGEKLIPFHIVTWGHRAGREHAFFTIKDRVITVDYVTNEFAKITRYEAKVEKQKVVVKVEKLWEGYPKELPNLFQKYEPAVKASVEKANCYHCREPHYYREAS